MGWESMTCGFKASSAVCFASLGAMMVISLLIWKELLPKISLNVFHRTRLGLAIFAIGYAVYSGARMVANVKPGTDIPKEFIPELTAYVAFWVLVPPAWFFLEYFAVANDCIAGFPGGCEKNLKSVKDHADYASKIWAGVLALLLALIALKK